MAFTLNRRLAQLVDSNGQLNTGKIPNDYITSDHVADNTVTSAMLHTSFTVSSSNLSSIDTDAVSEGSTNLYYTDSRVGTYISGNRTFGNITTTGYIAGPATFTIDPAAVGDNTGTVVIAGNLQVDGTTTTINSTTMSVDDLNITLASGAENAAAANGAGITIDGASATITYDGTNNEWEFNRSLKINGPTGGSNPQIEFLNTNGVIRGGKNIAGTGTDTLQLFNNGLGVAVEYGGFVGIGTADPSSKLHIQGNSDSGDEHCQLVIEDTDTDSGSQVPSIQFRADGSNTVRMRGTSTEGLVISGSSAQGDDLVVQSGGVGIGTSSPYKKLEVVGDIQLDATDANIWIKSGAVGTNGFINWTFNTNDSVFNKIGMDYDTRATTGFHIDAGYPITIDASASGGKAINFDIGGVTKAVIDGTGLLGIANDSPSYLVDVGTAASTQSNIFRGTVNGDFIFTLAKNTTNLFSIRNNNTSIVHLNTQNNATLALGVSSTNNTGTTEHQVRIFANGTMAMTATAAGNGSSIFSTGGYGTSQGDNKTHFGYNNNGTYNNYIRGSTTIFSSRVKFDQPLSDSITIDGDNIDPYVYIDGSTNNRDSGVKINAGSGYVNTLRMDAGNNLYIHNNAILINGSGTVIIANNNDDYSFKAMGGDTDSWFGVYDDSNDSANIIVTRSNTIESFKHLGHTGETVIKATGTGLRIESTDNEAIQISGNGGGLNFQTGTNQRIYFNSHRAMEGSSTGTSLQIGESYSVINLQGNTVVHGNLTPSANNTYDLGSSTMVWRDLYIGDLILSNETRKNDDGSTGNSVDGTTGNWTIQEGSDELYLINNKNGKKYKFVLQEIE